MNKYKMVLNTLGRICVFVSASMLLPVICALYYKEYSLILAFINTAVISACVGVGIVLLTKKHSKADIGFKYSAVIVVAGWLVAILISSIPIFIITGLNFSQSFFESASGWTTTGLTLVDVSVMPKAILLWRSLMQYFGGIGVIFVLQILLPNPRTAILYNSEGHSELVLPNMKKTLRIITTIYIGYTLLGIILYVCGGMGFFDAVNHSMTAIATGGFSTQANSIGAYNSIYIEAVTILLMILGSINFSLHILLFTRKFKAVVRFFELRVYAVVLVVFIPLIIFGGLYPLYGIAGQSIRAGIFESVSAVTTTGFSISNNFASWNGFALICLMLLMIIGGQSGSTAGGLKLYRLGIMGKSFYWNIKSKLNGVNKVYQPYIHNAAGKTYIKQEDISANNTFVLLYLTVLICGALALSAFGYSFTDSLFEFTSVIGTIGMSIGVTSTALPDFALWIMTFGMLVARLESGVILLAIGKIFSDIVKRVKA